MKRILQIAAIAILVLIALWYITDFRIERLLLQPTEVGAPLGTSIDAPEQDLSVVANNLEVPWGVAFLPDESLLITERTGTVVHIHGQGERTKLAIPETTSTGEGGLLGIALHPLFGEKPFVYLYHTAENPSGGLINKVVRYTWQADTLIDPQPIIENIPGARFHDGGRLAFGPDGFLYITTGDAGDAQSAQDLESLAGKILRLSDDGSIPPENPFGDEIYSYGHRNPQGLAWDAAGRLWSTEHGRSGVQSGMDELNLIVRGGNYGWPIVEGDEVQNDMIAPVLHSGPDVTWAPAGLAHKNGSLFWGGLRGSALYEARITADGAELVAAHFSRELGRLRTTHIAPDGLLYFTTSNTDGRGTPATDDDRLLSIGVESL